jgi:hypothetical protein
MMYNPWKKTTKERKYEKELNRNFVAEECSNWTENFLRIVHQHAWSNRKNQWTWKQVEPGTSGSLL